MSENSTTRFTARVGNYVRFRPGYPPQVAALLATEALLSPDSQIADIGSGTGLLAIPFLDAGYAVTGIEPNREMREAGDTFLAGYPRFRSLDAHAEATRLPDHSIALVIAGQAFHWFDVAKTRHEWVRILKPAGVAALIWNKRCLDAPFMREIEAITDSYAAETDTDGSIREAGQSRIAGFFAPSPFQVTEFPNAQRFNLEGLIGRIASSSYLPNVGTPRYDAMAAALTRVFDRNQQGGEVTFDYRTKVFWGKL